MQRQRFFIQAHRIFGSEALQNSLAAVQKAASSQIDSIETDAFLSKDGEVFIVHGDTSLGKCALRPIDQPDAEYKDLILGQLTAAELHKLTYKKLEGGKIPTLGDLLEAFKPTKIVLNIEIKEICPDIVGKIIGQFQAQGMLGQLFLSSFHHYHRREALEYCQKQGLPNVPFGFLTYSVYEAASQPLLQQTVPGDAITLSQAALRQYERGYPALRAAAADRGVHINVWFDGVVSDDVETLETYRHLHDLGIHTIITNHPTKALLLNANF